MSAVIPCHDPSRVAVPAGERGLSIIIALFFVILVAGLVTSGTLMMRANTDLSEVRFRREAQADQFARSGLAEALSWMRRQTTQPVVTFEPQRDLVASIPVLDTEEPDIGLVREFQIADDIWGRYEVWKQWDADPDPVRLAFRKKFQCRDLSDARGAVAPGSVWLIRSVGYVFQRRDASKVWNAKPNRVLALVTLECEAQRSNINLPTQSAVSARDGSAVTVNTMGEIQGGATAAGIGYPSASGVPTIASGIVTGSPALSGVASYSDAFEDVFGVTESELRAMADLVISDPDDFPDPIPDYAIVFCDCGAISFDAKRSLNGAGLVFIRGDTSFAAGNTSLFSGLLFVDGGLRLRESSEINGSVIVRQWMTVEGSGARASIKFDDKVLAALRRNIGKYRWSGALRPVINRE